MKIGPRNFNSKKLLTFAVLCFAFAFSATSAFAALTLDATSITSSGTLTIPISDWTAGSLDPAFLIKDSTTTEMLKLDRFGALSIRGKDSSAQILLYNHPVTGGNRYAEFNTNGGSGTLALNNSAGVLRLSLSASGSGSIFLTNTSNFVYYTLSTSGGHGFADLGRSDGSIAIHLAANGVSYFAPAAGNLGIGTITPSAKVHSLATTEQLRLGYDASNYNSFTVGSTGSLTIAATGTSPTITLSSPVIVSSALNKGTCILGTSCAAITVSAGAICTATDTTAIAATRAVVSGTTLTITGNGTDTIAYTCL